MQYPKTTLVLLLIIAGLVIGWGSDRAVMKKYYEAQHQSRQPVQPHVDDTELGRNKATEMVGEGIALLALLKSVKEGSAEYEKGYLKMELVSTVLMMGTFEKEINALNGLRAEDIACLLLHELGCTGPDDVDLYFEIAKQELRSSEIFQNFLEIKDFLQRALSEREVPEPVAKE